MDLFTGAGIFTDKTSGRKFFSVVLDKFEQPILSQSFKEVFSKIQGFGHVYKICRHAKYLKLECVSELAESFGIKAPIFHKVSRVNRKDIIEVARRLV